MKTNNLLKRLMIVPYIGAIITVSLATGYGTFLLRSNYSTKHDPKEILKEPNNSYPTESDELNNFKNTQAAVNGCLKTLSDCFISENELFGEPFENNPEIRKSTPWSFFLQSRTYRPINYEDNYHTELKNLILDSRNYVIEQKKQKALFEGYPEKLREMSKNMHLTLEQRKKLEDMAQEYQEDLDNIKIGIPLESENGLQIEKKLRSYDDFLKSLNYSGYTEKLAQKEAEKRERTDLNEAIAFGILTFTLITGGLSWSLHKYLTNRSLDQSKSLSLRQEQLAEQEKLALEVQSLFDNKQE